MVSFFQLEKRLDTTEHWPAYVQFMREYLDLNHMELVDPDESNDNPKYYIPHREVIRKDSATTPLRVVFNASSLGKNSISLNDALMKGPQTQSDLFDILLRVRTSKYCFTADVAKMYRVVKVNKIDCDMQRIFWREDSSQPLQEYHLLTLTYGEKPASFIATYCLGKIAEEIRNEHPAAAEAIKKCCYMDDFIVGRDTEQELIAIQNVIHEALSAHGFILRKYLSNSSKLLANIEENLRATSSCCRLTDKMSVLGVNWVPEPDLLSIKINFSKFEKNLIPTRRLVLSFTSLVFDPLGLVSPVALNGKLLLQLLWKEQSTKWDTPIPQLL